ncbi:E3 ubiquitin-protein ligase sina [Taenia solium]|eukprot:TsM_000394100 transcript=TsM_000394100 gene=TsM_000394100
MLPNPCSPFRCACSRASCKWLGQLDQVMPRLLQNHKPIDALQGENLVLMATDSTLPGAVDWVANIILLGVAGIRTMPVAPIFLFI